MYKSHMRSRIPGLDCRMSSGFLPERPGNTIGSSAGFSQSSLSMVLNSSIVGSRHWTADFSAVSSTERNAFSAETNNGVPMQAFRPL